MSGLCIKVDVKGYTVVSELKSKVSHLINIRNEEHHLMKQKSWLDSLTQSEEFSKNILLTKEEGS